MLPGGAGKTLRGGVAIAVQSLHFCLQWLQGRPAAESEPFFFSYVMSRCE
ncbi:hypothetical protein CDAR_465131, partial [Caerostris darwini]